MSGHEVARTLRRQIPGSKIIALSGWGQTEDRRLTSEAGFDHHLVKPVGVEELRKLLV
jgi:DNA-binding response OmpR family regulator